LAKSKKKKTNKITKQFLGTLLLSAVICLSIYIVYVIIDLIANPTDKFIIQNDLLTAEESTVGYVIREESIIKAKDNEKEIVKIKDEGEKVAKGENILRYCAENEEEINKQIQSLDEQIQEAYESQQGLFSSDIKSLEHQIEEKLGELRGKNSIEEIVEYKKDINNYISKKAKIAGELSPAGSYINDLIKEREVLEKELYNSTEYVVADKSGVVSYRIDNLEDTLTPDNFEILTRKYLEDLELKTGQLVASNNNLVKIVNNFNCYLAIITDSEEAETVKEGDSIYLRLLNVQKVKAQIEYIKDDGGRKVIVLKITEGVEKLINYRKISVDVIWWENEGLKVPNSSIIYENGLSYIVKTASGNLNKILVKIVDQNENYCIIRNYKTSELEEMGYTAEEIRKIKQVNIYDEILVNPYPEEL